MWDWLHHSYMATVAIYGYTMFRVEISLVRNKTSNVLYGAFVGEPCEEERLQQMTKQEHGEGKTMSSSLRKRPVAPQ